MIVIRRKPGESVWVGGAEVKVLSLSPSRVKLGVAAPAQMAVLRGEVMASMEQNQIATRRTDDLPALLHALRWNSGAQK